MRISSFFTIGSLILLAACSTGGGSANSSSSSSIDQSQVVIISPVMNTTVGSPLVVKGKARGTWFFEGTLPVELQDDDGQVIAQSPGMAQTDWMTEEWVEFEATLVFSTGATSGIIVIRKDNPSGLPENDASVSIPVTF